MTTRPGKRTTTQPIDAPQQLLGRVLDGRYRLEEVLNVGGMGIVFLASQLVSSRSVAVKVLRPTLSSDVDLNTRFQQEIETLSRLNHPHIVTLHDCGQDAAGLHYLVMEYVGGRTLREMLESCELSLPEILNVFSQVCDALVEAHAAGIIHRDLKFENIMLRRLEDGRPHVTILDFGVAKLLTRNDSVTRSGEVPGTPGIIAPELVDAASPSPQSDLYSLGILLFTALSGSAPFAAENEFELMRAHKTNDLPRLDELVGDRVPEELIDVVAELTQKDPKRRPPGAEAVRDRLERIMHSVERRHPDVSRYIPPRGQNIKPLATEPTGVDRSIEFLDDANGDEEPVASPGRDLLLAPTSVVGLLIAVLIVLVLVLLYFVYTVVVLKTPVQ
jgi:serine/threonine-protein kinase